jgi:hypothetical protein
LDIMFLNERKAKRVPAFCKRFRVAEKSNRFFNAPGARSAHVVHAVVGFEFPHKQFVIERKQWRQDLIKFFGTVIGVDENGALCNVIQTAPIAMLQRFDHFCSLEVTELKTNNQCAHANI